MKMKTNLDSVLQDLIDQGFDPNLTQKSYESIASCGLRSKNLQLAIVATRLLLDEKPCTLRGLFYRVVSAGFLPSTDRVHYQRVGRLMTTLREAIEAHIPTHTWERLQTVEQLEREQWSDVLSKMTCG